MISCETNPIGEDPEGSPQRHREHRDDPQSDDRRSGFFSPCPPCLRGKDSCETKPIGPGPKGSPQRHRDHRDNRGFLGRRDLDLLLRVLRASVVSIRAKQTQLGPGQNRSQVQCNKEVRSDSRQHGHGKNKANSSLADGGTDLPPPPCPGQLHQTNPMPGGAGWDGAPGTSTVGFLPRPSPLAAPASGLGGAAVPNKPNWTSGDARPTEAPCQTKPISDEFQVGSVKWQADRAEG